MNKQIRWINSYYVTYKQAKELKALGFNDNCYQHYLNGNLRNNEVFYNNQTLEEKFTSEDEKCISAPLYNQAFEFLRNKFNLIGCVILLPPKDDVVYAAILYIQATRKRFKTYEDAETYLLDKLIEKANEVLQ